MTDTVLFDLFGVIARHQSTEGKNRLTRTAGVAGPGFWDAYWELRPPYDRGEVNGPGYWRQVADAIGACFDDRRITDLVEADIASWSAVDDTMVALVEELAAAGRHMGCCPTSPKSWPRTTKCIMPGSSASRCGPSRAAWATPSPSARPMSGVSTPCGRSRAASSLSTTAQTTYVLPKRSACRGTSSPPRAG